MFLLDESMGAGMRKALTTTVVVFSLGYLAWGFVSAIQSPTYQYNVPSENQSIESMAQENAVNRVLVKDRNQKQLIRYADQTEWSICYIHGFTASPMELQPVISQISQDLKANLFVTRLSGHGLKDPSQMASVKGQDWINDAMECLTVAQRMGNKAILMGTSFGGTLATLVAINAPKPPFGLILVSPNFGVKDKAGFLLAGTLGKPLSRIVFGKDRVFKAENDEHGFYWTTKHPSIVLQEFMRVTHALKRQNYKKIKSPVLIAYTPDDEVLDVSKIKAFYEKITPRVKLLISEPVWDKHVLAGDIVNPKGNKALKFYVEDFINKNL